jgi:hypothetical protein
MSFSQVDRVKRTRRRDEGGEEETCCAFCTKYYHANPIPEFRLLLSPTRIVDIAHRCLPMISTVLYRAAESLHPLTTYSTYLG